METRTTKLHFTAALLVMIFGGTLTSAQFEPIIINTSLPEVSYVMEPFESLDYISIDDPSSLSLSDDALFGNFSLLVQYIYTIKDAIGREPEAEVVPTVNRTQEGTTRFTILEEKVDDGGNSGGLSFGWMPPERPHNCHGATHMSFWYKVLELEEKEDDLEFRLTLLEQEDQYFSYAIPVNTNNSAVKDWQQVRIQVDQFLKETTTGGGKKKNRFLNLKSIRGWQVDLIAISRNNSTSTTPDRRILLLLDQLACIGPGDLLGASLFSDLSWEQAVDEGIWIQEYYQSDLAENNSKVVLEANGTMAVDFTVMMAESWGGFTAFSYFAPDPAYYNLTGATDFHLTYQNRVAASVPGRTHLRIVLSDDSHCAVNCSTDLFQHERWYSFHYVLDDNVTNGGWGEIHLPLEGSLEPDTPLWLTGWAGIMGNQELDISHLKGFTLEFNIDSQGNMSSTVSGALDMMDLSAMVVNYNETAAGASDIVEGICNAEQDLYLVEQSILFVRKEFLGNKCCQLCHEDETCLYGLTTGRDCFLASYIESDMVGLLTTELMQDEVTVFWMNDHVRRGSYCERCDCHESNRTIDCRNASLLVIPATLPEDLGWTPRVLDLRNNTNLVVLGSGSMEAVAETLEELWLPKEMRHISIDSLKDLPKLKSIHYEEGGVRAELSNVIMEPSDAFGDVCCTPGHHLDFSPPSSGITFCDMEVDSPGADTKYLPFIQYEEATLYRQITPSSSFMFEAGESPEKCAEYCTIVGDCQYFSYDQRFPNAEHECLLYLDDGEGPAEVCCNPDHYADEAQTIPGWTSGLPPRTRHIVDNAFVVATPLKIALDPTSGYETSFELSLGSKPLRGAVWVTPTVSAVSSLDISFSPSFVVLYDSNSTATVRIKVSGITTDAKAASLVIINEIDSCDVAFMESSQVSANQSTTVIVDVEMPQTEEESNTVIVVVICVAVFGILVLGVVVYFEHKRKLNDSVWKVKEEELIFYEPPEVLGRGTFGLVLKATYRGTDVAVKRVIPPKEKFRSKGKRGSSTDATGERTDILEGMTPGRNCLVLGEITTADGPSQGAGHMSGTSSQVLGSQIIYGKKSRSSLKASMQFRTSYTKLKLEFMQEMRHLSKLRHPCITTVMGAVVSKKSEPMLVMEYMEHGSLWDLLHNETMILEGEILLPILRDISQGVRFLHAADPKVIHGDLKSHNILVDQKFRGKVADFGLSQKKIVGATGTPFWMAPELLRGHSNTTASDVYAFGVILYEVYSRRDPYEGEDARAVLRLVADKNVNKRPPVPPHMPAPIQSLMSDCLVEDPSERPTFHELDDRLKRADIKSVEPTELRKSSVPKSGTISLFDIFPRHIAEALSDGRKVEAEHRDCVTIFFSDIVGFTTISSTLSPRKVANMLDRLYRAFDHLSTLHDVYKVETIGDAYMCCGNLVKDQEDHVKRIAEFAVDAVAVANTIHVDEDDPDSKTLQIRVGFHSGAVVADVVGTRNPRFCLFGDTVNVSSRMESSSEPGRIHCSQAAADLLKIQLPSMPLTCRGTVNIKGKGEMITYWVNRSGQRKSFIHSLHDLYEDEECHPEILDLKKTILSIIEEPSGELDLEALEESEFDDEPDLEGGERGRLLSSSLEQGAHVDV